MGGPAGILDKMGFADGGRANAIYAFIDCTSIEAVNAMKNALRNKTPPFISDQGGDNTNQVLAVNNAVAPDSDAMGAPSAIHDAPSGGEEAEDKEEREETEDGSSAGEAKLCYLVAWLLGGVSHGSSTGCPMSHSHVPRALL